MNNKDLNQPIYIDEYDYPLPDERIAKYPLQQRDASKLLVYRKGEISENKFSSITDFLPENALLVYNNTRVIQARLVFHKDTGARIEVFCLEPLNPADYAQSLSSTTECVWKCMVGNLKKWKGETLGKTVVIDGRAFSFKGGLLGAAMALGVVSMSHHRLPVFSLLSLILFTSAVAAYLALNYTGCSTFTSLSGVKKEIKFALPVIIGMIVLSGLLQLMPLIRGM